MNSGTQITMRGMGHILGIYMRAVNFRRNQYLGVYERWMVSESHWLAHRRMGGGIHFSLKLPAKDNRAGGLIHERYRKWLQKTSVSIWFWNESRVARKGRLRKHPSLKVQTMKKSHWTNGCIAKLQIWRYGDLTSSVEAQCYRRLIHVSISSWSLACCTWPTSNVGHHSLPSKNPKQYNCS